MNYTGAQAPQGDLRASTGKILHRPTDVRDMLGIGNTTFYRLVNGGKLKIVKIGSASRVTDGSLRAYVASLVEEAA